MTAAISWAVRVAAGLVLAATITAGASGPAYADPTPTPAPAPTAPATPTNPSTPATPSPTPGTTPSPPATTPSPTTPATIPNSSPEADPSWWDVPGQIRKGMNDFFAWVAETSLAPVLNVMGQTILATPDLTGNPKVDAVRTTFLVIANACFILFVIFAGFVITTRETLHNRYGLKEMAPRLVIGFAAANLSGLICTLLISLANTLTQAIVGSGVDGPQASAALEQALTGGILVGPGASASGFMASMLILAALVMGLVVVITWCLRLAMLLILVGIAPMALAFHATPQTEGLAFAWWRSFIAVLGIQIGQAIVLLATIKVFLTPDGPVINGIPSTASGMLGVCMAISMLWLMLKIPTWMKHFVMGPLRGKGAISQIIQTVAAIKTLGVSAAAVTAVKSSARKSAKPPALPAPAQPTPARPAAVAARTVPRGIAQPMFSHAPLTHAPLPAPAGSAQSQFSHPPIAATNAGVRAGSAGAGFSHPAPVVTPWRATSAPPSRPVFSNPQDLYPPKLRAANPATSTAPPVSRPTPPVAFSHPAPAQTAPQRPPAPVIPVFSDAPKPAPRTSRKKKS